MMLLDSNIIIYAFLPEHRFLHSLLVDQNSCSAFTKLEVLGYPNLSQSKIEQFEICFDNLNIISIDSLIIEKAILLRQQNKMKAGDALIAATALLNDLILVTRNTKDFSHVSNIHLLNPFEL